MILVFPYVIIALLKVNLIGGKICQEFVISADAEKWLVKKVSHAENKSNRTFELNLQETTIEIDGKPTKVKACTKCIKTARKSK